MTAATPVYTGGTEGDSAKTHTHPQSYPIVSNPSANRKQSNDRSCSDQGSASTPNNAPLLPPSKHHDCECLSPRSMARSTTQSFPGNYRDVHTIVLFFLHGFGLFFTYYLVFWGWGAAEVWKMRWQNMIRSLKLDSKWWPNNIVQFQTSAGTQSCQVTLLCCNVGLLHWIVCL